MLPSILAKQLEKGIGDYIETTFPMTNKPFKGSVQNMLARKNAVYHEPYTAVRLPFRTAAEQPNCFEAIHIPFRPYVHQEKAFERLTGDDGRSTLIATGTGSGKTECFLYPILEYCYQHRGERGIKALIIYPMNALASDQARRIAETIWGSDELRGNVTVGMYVGGEGHVPARMMGEKSVITDHETLLNSPPDILMTNYKMLDYLLVRPRDTVLWQDNNSETLKYIAVDELHTFDGAQGTDLACLLRRMKHRLRIADGYLCCVGTSATMGSKDNEKDILQYASEIFGEPFENDAVIAEDRLSAEEFFADSDITEFSVPNAAQMEQLETLAGADDQEEYLKLAVASWLPEFANDPLTIPGRLALGNALMHHSFLQAMITLTGGNYYQASAIAKALDTNYPELREVSDPSAVIHSLFALISYARSGNEKRPIPFLFVQVQLWMRELRRLVAKVDPEEIVFELATDLNKQQAKKYLPVVNCRECGATGWVTVLNEKQNAAMTSLDAFYNLYFRGDERIFMAFPHSHENLLPGMTPGHICPECMKVYPNEQEVAECPACGINVIPILWPAKIASHVSGSSKQYSCPFCGSHRGLSLMGLRSATEISASISQMFASRFNDDKKTLAFSDNIQDAAHRAGFFNARTWRFGMRTAMQHYCNAGGAGQSLADFREGFIRHWHEKMTPEDFTAFFIGPNMTWMRTYEEMVKNRKLESGKASAMLVSDIENRIRYEIMLEYGVASRIGRTLEKSGCSMLHFAEEDILTIAEAVQERIINEEGELTSAGIGWFRQVVLHYLTTMRLNGAFNAPVFRPFLENGGKGYLLSNQFIRWLPGEMAPYMPHFPAVFLAYAKSAPYFDAPNNAKYMRYLVDSCPMHFVRESTFVSLCTMILEEAEKVGVLQVTPSPVEYRVYGINPNRIYVSDRVRYLRCDHCGSVSSADEVTADMLRNSACEKASCCGKLIPDEELELGYYGHLYSNGDLARINAREHTGMLERGDRELLEHDFKLKKGESAIWDPNILSCTPTLEMGIDIGDLSTVILCSMPPAQSQFLQRAGRAGRTDGNALTLAVANAKPHDLYFYADPLDMIAGNVTPPKIFLRASAVLERQFVAFCMDSWVRRGISENAIPEKISIILNKLDIEPDDMFPFNFIHYVDSTVRTQINSFVQMFSAYLDEATIKELREFAFKPVSDSNSKSSGKDSSSSRMSIKILDSFQSQKKQQEALQRSVSDLTDMISDLKAKPQDSSRDAEINEISDERQALIGVLKEIGNKNVFNFLSDEGLLPNYAFPEQGIVLRAVLYRKEEDSNGASKKSYEKTMYEYSRSASSAISEFAPNNSFYVGGRKLTIDQVDLTTAQATKWRLCPNCSHAQIEEAEKNTSCCPQCGTPAWADAGQVKTMLKVQMVYSNMDYNGSLINDESEERTNVFYSKQLLVDVDEEKDIISAYRMNNADFPFGYDFVRKAALREINFGESDISGQVLSVAGVEEPRKGFRVCSYCGKIQPEKGKPSHTFSCKTKKIPSLLQQNAYEDCMFLYREFNTEILRLLIPATTMDSTAVKQESFVAAFMLGMKEYFGNVDHLRATITEVPVPDVDFRKQYLVIYDSVPGGTGYLKQLMHEKMALVEIFERALAVMENCSCKSDSNKDGCYHCLYAYRQSRHIGNISRSTAIRLLKSILSGKNSIEKIKGIGDISVNPIVDSELEQQFIDLVRAKVGSANFKDIIRNGKHGYRFKLGDNTWELELQVSLDAQNGVSVKCKPDFVFWPENQSTHQPVAVFTDGYTYHHDIADDDTLKRAAVRRSGAFRVWSLSYKDVQSEFGAQGVYSSPALDNQKMTGGMTFYNHMVKANGGDAVHPETQSPMQLLFAYLSLQNGELIFRSQAVAYSYSLLAPKLSGNASAYNAWKSVIDDVHKQIYGINSDYKPQTTWFGEWSPCQENGCLSIYAGIKYETAKEKGPATVCAVLHDKPTERTEKYEHELNELWHFDNIMQFIDSYIAVSTTGLAKMVYQQLPPSAPHVLAKSATPTNDGWEIAISYITTDDAIEFARAAQKAGIPAPGEDDIGYEPAGKNGETIATIEIAWPDLKLGYLTAEQEESRSLLESLGWRFLSLLDIPNANSLFGGNN